MNVKIFDGIIISDGAAIGAEAILSKNIPPYAVAVDNPIQILKYRLLEEIIKSLLTSRWWDKNDVILKEAEILI